MPHRLHATYFSARTINDNLNQLEYAIAGEETLLPLPAHDPQRATLLTHACRAGDTIDPSIALVVATSGSTGTPKGAQLTPANLVASADATHQHLGGAGHWVLALPPHHIAGIQVLVRSLIANTTPTVLDVSEGFNIPAFADATRDAARDAAGDPLYTSLVPMQLAKAMETLEGIRALRQYSTILVGGAAIDPALRDSAEKLNITLRATYGSSETAGGCVYDGTPIPGAKVRLDEGRIILGGPMIAAGYRTPISPDPFAHPGWFATSDAGEIRDGRLHVTGRIDAIINTGGMKVQPEVLEAELRTIPGVRDACVVGLPDARFGHIIAAAYTGPANPGEVLAAASDLPAYMVPKRLIRVDQLPTTGPGKTDRQATAALF